MKTGRIALFVSALLCSFSACATDVSIEGQWLVNGNAKQLQDTTCTVSVYATEDAASPLWATNGCRLATDDAGYFVVGATVGGEEPLPDVFWVGVKPDGFNEIAPRFRVAPVPFAIAADEVVLVKSDNMLVLDGVATVESLRTSGETVVGDWILPSGGQVAARNMQLDSARLASLSLASGCSLGLFNDGSREPSCDYDKFSAEPGCSHSVEAHIAPSGWFFVKDESETRDLEAKHTFAGDGFLVIAIKAEPKQCPASKLVVDVGGQTVYNGEVGVKKGGTVKRLMTVPYRSGENVYLKLTAVGGGTVPFGEQSSYPSNIGVKLRFVKFGRD